MISREAAISYRLDDQIGFKLGRAFNKAHVNLRRRITDFEITTQQLAVLMRLHEQGDVSQNSLGRMVGMKPATIHGIVKRLEGRGLIAARRSPEDQRLILVALTDAGRDMAENLQQHSEAATAQTLEPLSPTEQKTIKALLDKFVTD